MVAATALSPARRLRRRLAAGALLASAPVNAVGLTALVAMYVGFTIGERPTAMTLGRTNDILGLVGTALMMPAVFEIYALTGPGRRPARASLAIVGLGAMVAIVGLGAMVAIVWLQYLLITERLTFEAQLPLVMLAYLALAIWFVGGGWIASRAGVMQHGARLGAAGALYFGQPWWAYRWARYLLEVSTMPSAAIPDRVTAEADSPAGT